MNELARYIHNSSISKKKKNGLLKKVDVNYCIPDTLPGKKEIRRWAGYTSLHFAVENNELDLAHELLKQGADIVKQSTKDGYTPLHAVMDKLYFDKYTIREVQIHSLINSLLFRQVEINNIINPKCKRGISHLHIACLVNHVAAVELFAEAKESLSQAISNDVQYLEGYTPLHCAINSLSVESADVLLRHGADVHVKNTKGFSCVELLVQCIMDINKEKTERLESIIKLVLKLSIDNETLLVDSGLSDFHLACILKDKSIAEDFLKKNVDVNMPVNSESKFWPGWMPIHFAACINVDMMILLMQKGANLMIKNSRGETAFDFCAKRFTAAEVKLVLSMENGFKDIVLSDNCTKLSDLLLVMDNCNTFHDFLQKLKNVKVTIPQNSPIWPGYNLLHLSMSLKGLKVSTKCRILLSFLKAMVDLSETNKHYNSTAREEALYIKRIKLLLEHGCDVNMTNSNGQTPIHLAFAMKDKSTAKKLLTHSEDNVVDRDGLSHLHIACALGQLDAVKRYLNQGADVNCRVTSAFTWRDTSNGRFEACNSTPLHLAVLFYHDHVVEYLLANNADVYAEDSLGFTPIHLTMLTQVSASSYTADLLFRATPNLRDSVSSVGLSHLHVAAWANNSKAVEDLLRNAADIERVVDPDVEKSFPPLKNWAGETPLLVAGTADAAVVASLVNSGANVHAKDLQGSSALQLALRDLFSISIDPFIRKVKAGECEVDSYGITRLHVACAKWDLEWARQLLENGAKVNARVDNEQIGLPEATPMDVLVCCALTLSINNHELLDFVQLLLDYGADLNVANAGTTALHLIHGHCYGDAFVDEAWTRVPGEFFLHAADLLLRSLRSYDVNPLDRRGLSHFHIACVRNDVETATKFLDHGADVNETMDPFVEISHGFAPLHSAMAYRCREVAHLLLDRSADVNKEDVHGNRPLHIAAKKKFFDLPLIEAMLSRGADYHAKNLNNETFLYCFLQFSNRNVDKYLQTFDLLMSYGFDFDQEDVEGTPLNEAAYFCNLEATKALLQLGADMNAVDIESQFPLDDLIAAADFNEHKIEVVKALACHVWKMKFIGLDARESNLRCLERVEGSFSIVSSLEQTCQDELTKARETEICQGLTVNDFLSELGAVAEYPRMSSIRQGIVDNFFKHTVYLRREFPEFCGFLVSQYKKVPPRMELWHSAKEATYYISDVDLPDLCVEAILRFLTNAEMELLIESVKEFM